MEHLFGKYISLEWIRHPTFKAAILGRYNVVDYEFQWFFCYRVGDMCSFLAGYKNGLRLDYFAFEVRRNDLIGLDINPLVMDNKSNFKWSKRDDV